MPQGATGNEASKIIAEKERAPALKIPGRVFYGSIISINFDQLHQVVIPLPELPGPVDTRTLRQSR